MAFAYTYNVKGAATNAPTPLKAWPPPFSKHDDTLSGSAPNLIKWRAAASLAVVFLATDIAHAAPFLPGYEIPEFLNCRIVRSTQRLKKVPTVNVGYSELSGSTYLERWGYLDDSSQGVGPKGCFLVSDWEYLATHSDILVIGVPFSAGAAPWEAFEGTVNERGSGGRANIWTATISAMTGAGVEVGQTDPGHTLIHNGSSSSIATASLAAITAYAQARGAHTIDVAWCVDDTGSMGSRQDDMKNAAVSVTQQLLAAGYNAWFSYCTFADWGPADVAKTYPDVTSLGWGENGDDPYQVRFPFQALTTTTQAQFAALSVPGQGGDDGPESALEALCRMYVARASVLTGAHLLGGSHMDPIADLSGRLLAR